MSHNIAPGTYKIVSLIEGKPPVGVNLTRPGLQFVHLNARVTTWVIRKEGDKAYLLSVGGYPYTGIIDDKVAAFIDGGQKEWIATHRELHDAYTIAPIDDQNRGWTVADPNSNDSKIEIRPIISTKSLPPRFLPTQLFQFVAA